ncbi:MAG: iron-sulfur cluster assembly scaffold protein [Syntrophaceae bacterium]|nr:iron-sulfur cluster assembly scaffold protein [Syntrophaceae bacterium]
MSKLVNLAEFFATANKHAKTPHNKGAIDDFNGYAKITGPCGTTMEFWLKVQDSKIKKISFTTDGCEPSLASGSVTTCLAEGKSIEGAKAISQQDVLNVLEGLPKDHEHCALLAVNTLKAACEDYLNKQKSRG